MPSAPIEKLLISYKHYCGKTPHTVVGFSLCASAA
jgi:hypothetical protein